jgi:hypothetical protein
MGGTGELSEWLKEHAWKVCIPLKGIKGSNPLLSAEKISRLNKPMQIFDYAGFFIWQCTKHSSETKILLLILSGASLKTFTHQIDSIALLAV